MILSVLRIELIAQQIDTESEWRNYSESMENLTILSDFPVGGRTDLVGNGALLLEKMDTSKPFWKTSKFQREGEWTSAWINESFDILELSWSVYGQAQDMTKGWTKFEGNPLISSHRWKHNTSETHVLPSNYSDKPADQSLVKGVGEYEGKWLLFFNIGGWAVKGWGMLIADELSPLKDGINPFMLGEPYPLTKATGGYNAPNDWIYADGLWYAPDESLDQISRMWISEDLKHWVLTGPIFGINGHDPGMAWDGEHYYLFNEADDKITLVYADDPLGTWKEWPENEGGIALDIGDHTGDADVAFFNNRWHMFVDDGIHKKYKLSYATTTAEDFPLGWKVVPEFFGPYNPDQGQLWDDDTIEGNDFGTGDADVALEGHTLYMTYEFPVGIAFKDLDVLDDAEQRLRLRIEYKSGNRISTTDWIDIKAGEVSLTPGDFDFNPDGKEWRMNIEMRSDNSTESPLLEYLNIE